MDNINVLIVNYNTTKLTNACIKSVIKTTQNAKIFVFDNSDKEPFKSVSEGVTVIDNTKCQLVDFNLILSKYENKTEYGAKSGFGTLKHAASVDKCFDLINDNFILLDSDVLVKKDLSELYNDKYIYIGQECINGLSKNIRVSPHICFINVKKCKENGIRYFDESRIVGLSKEGDDYDTGSSFYFDCKGHNSSQINEKEWIEHYCAGSWSKGRNQDNWLIKNKSLWFDNTVTTNDVDIFICTHKSFKPSVKSNTYKILDSRYMKPNLPLKDDFFSEFYQYKYVYDNIPLKKYVGFCHYRRYFSFLDSMPNIDELFEKYDAIVSKPLQYKSSVKQQYSNCHNIEDLYIIGGILADKYPEYCNSWRNFINGKLFIPYNMFIMKQEDFKEYCKFIFEILDEYLKIVGTDIRKRVEDNKDKYLKDKYPNNTIDYQYRIGGYIGERLTNVFIMTHFKRMKTYPVIVTEDKYKQEKKEQSNQ